MRCGFVSGKILRCGAVRLNRTAPHHTTPYRTVPHFTAPHRTVKSLGYFGTRYNKHDSLHHGVFFTYSGLGKPWFGSGSTSITKHSMVWSSKDLVHIRPHGIHDSSVAPLHLRWCIESMATMMTNALYHYVRAPHETNHKIS